MILQASAGKQMRGKLFRRGAGAIVNVELPALPEVLEFDGRVWRRKSEFHVTLVGSSTLGASGPPEVARAGAAIRRAGRGLRFEVILLDELWLVREAGAATLIRLCSLPAAEEFFDRLDLEMEQRIERPPYHVTLYTSGTSKGIGIDSVAARERMGRRLEAAERDALLRAMA